MKNKSIVFVDNWEIEVQNREMKKEVGNNEILVKNHYSLISAGTELACLAGKEASWFKFPGIPGYSCIGEVIDFGSKVKDVEKGDLLFCYGSHSAYIKLTTDDIYIKIDKEVKEVYIPFIRMATIAICSTRVSDIELGDNVAVAGMGIVGNLAAQLAGLQGGKVFALDIIKKRLNIASKCNIDYVIQSSDKVIQDYVDKHTKSGFNTLIDATGLSSVIVNFLSYVARRGEVILLGTPRDKYITDVTKVLRGVHLADNDLLLKGAHEWKYPVKENEFIKHSFFRNSEICLNLIKNNKLNIEPLITHVIKPEDTQEVYQGLSKKSEDYLGVVIDWN